MFVYGSQKNVEEMKKLTEKFYVGSIGLVQSRLIKKPYRNLYGNQAIISLNSNNCALFEVKNKILYTILKVLFFIRLKFGVLNAFYRQRQPKNFHPLHPLYQEWRPKNCHVKELLDSSVYCYA
jgi:hypothetical protein